MPRQGNKAAGARARSRIISTSQARRRLQLYFSIIEAISAQIVALEQEHPAFKDSEQTLAYIRHKLLTASWAVGELQHALADYRRPAVAPTAPSCRLKRWLRALFKEQCVRAAE